MKLIITLLLVAGAFAATAQTKSLVVTKSKEDTLLISGNTLPVAAKFGSDLYSFRKMIPGQKLYTIDFNGIIISALFKYLDLSTAPHLEIEQLKNYLRLQLNPQLEPK